MKPRRESEVGYLELIRGNPDLRRIWISDITSLLGDWFNTIALYTLVERLTGSPLALGGIFITKMLSFALASPVAGLLADRFDRRRLMIACDLARAVVVLGFLVVDDPGEVPLLYFLTAIQIAIGAAFLPARNAVLPSVTTPRELVTANTLMAATWSALLAVGAALGGLAAEWLGMKAVFLIDSGTYLVSASFLVRTTIPSLRSPRDAGKSLVGEALGGILAGWRYLLAHPQVARMALVKTAWSAGGSGLVYMLALLGKHLMPAATSVGIGLLFAARGLGTGIGPIAARAWVPARAHWPAMFGLGICCSGLAYLTVGCLPWTWWLLPLVLLAHTTSGANWTFSTVLLQERTSDEYRGRVFSTDLLLLTLVDAVAIFVAGATLEADLLSLRSAILVFASVQLVCGVLWLALAVPRERAFQSARRPASDLPEGADRDAFS